MKRKTKRQPRNALAEHSRQLRRERALDLKTRILRARRKSGITRRTLEPAELREIKKLRKAGWSLRAVAAQFDISHNTIYLIEKGEIYKRG